MRVLVVFAAASLAAAALASAAGAGLHALADRNAPAAMRSVLAGELGSMDTQMNLHASDDDTQQRDGPELVEALVPRNVFEALANGRTLQVLVATLLFGIALAQVPQASLSPLTESLDAVQRSCQVLTRWVNLPVPLVVTSITASQVALSGWRPLLAMLGFAATFFVAGVALVAVAVLVIKRRSGAGIRRVRAALREPLAIGIATNSSLLCMPTLRAGLVDALGFSRTRVELLVPITVALLRTGVVAYFVCATQFIASLHGRDLSGWTLLSAASFAVVGAFASAGMSGAVTLSLLDPICRHLGLPFDAAFVLLAAADPLCAPVRTGVTIAAAGAAVSVLCPAPDLSKELA